MMSYEEQEAARQERLSEVGTEMPCPFCNRPRVKRSDYIRCNPCGTNWLEGEDITQDPRKSRRTRATASTEQETSGTARHAASTTEDGR